MTTEKETQLTEAYKRYFNTCLNSITSENLEEIFVPDFMGFGTAVGEKLESFSALRTLMEYQIEQSKGVNVSFLRTPVFKHVSASDDVVVIVDEVTTTITVNNESMQFILRLSSVLEFTDGKWLVVHWHASKPEQVQSEVDTWGVEEWKQKTDALEKLVSERTADLIIKNNELEAAMANLKATQTQLIQSEKMASLGELTAGIAHEIQNPLNFVNNFSEVTTELVEEMEDAILKSDREEIVSISSNIKENLQKILHHGKRADAIVKGMLQHSQKSSGQKEPTDLNALCDEYLRLSYHGLRAKDKSFNATIKTDFDTSLEKVNIIPQDIGRVVLNLLTNAFYAVNEKKKQAGKDYEPTVTVKTSQTPPSGGRGVLISVSDNGQGIPQNIVDKIFQPFFTTKPTGQGTGLGLSLSYDIVKAHDGELKVETKEGEGTTFIISLPVNNK